MIVILAMAWFVPWKRAVEPASPAGPFADAPVMTVSVSRPARVPGRPVLVPVTADDTMAPRPAATMPEAVASADDAELQKFDPQLMQNSDFEDLVRDRLWLALDELNNPLVRKLGLTVDETGRLKNLIVSNLVMVAAEAGTSLDEGPAAVATAWDEALIRRQPRLDEQLRQLFGARRFAEYEAGREDYAQFNAVKFLDGGKAPLPDARAEQVIAVMQDERRIVGAAAAQAQAENGNMPLSAGDFLQMHELMADRVFGRVQNILDPVELAAFAGLQSQQLRWYCVKMKADSFQPGQ